MPMTISLDDLAAFDPTSSPSSHSRASTTSSSSSDRSRTRSFASSSSTQPHPSPLRQSTGPPLVLGHRRGGVMEYPAEIDFPDDDDEDDRAGDTLKASSGFKGIKSVPEGTVTTTQAKLLGTKSPGGVIVANERLVGNGKVRKLVVAPKKDKLQLKIDKERQKGIERGLEEMFDEDDAPKSRIKLNLKPRATRAVLEDLDALDWGEEDDDQATLKVTDAMKAQLPSPKSSTIRSLQDNPVVVPAPPPDSYEDDFADLTDANLGSFQKKLAAPKRMSLASNLDTSTTDEWDSPPAKPSTRRSGWNDGYDSSKRYSETSATSITSISTPRDSNSLELYEDDDAEFGLVLNDDFGSDRQNLIRRLDAKRQAFDTMPKGASHLVHHRRMGTDETNSTADASMEDGLVFGDAPRELSKRQLDKSRRKRANGQKVDGLGRTKEQQLEWEHFRERGWGRSTPLPPMPRDRLQRPPAVLPSVGHRSQSASKLQTLKDTEDPKRRLDSPSGIKASRSSLSSIHAQPPPPPSHSAISNQGPGPTTPSHPRALRSQRSQMLLPTESPSFGLSRKQSLPTLSEDFKPPHSPIDNFGPAEPRNSSSTSRLTRPTQSSLSKRVTRSRLPVQALFEPHERDIPDSSSISSISTNASARIQTESKYGSQGRSGGSAFIGKSGSLTKKDRVRSNGSENLDLDGLQLDDSPPRAPSVTGSAARRAVDAKVTKALPKDKMRAEQSSNKGSWGRSKGKKPKSTKLTLLRREDMSKAEYDTTEVQKNSGMTFNIEKGRWEGNEALSRDFDRVEAAPIRPALITQDSISEALGGKLGAGPASASSWIVGDMKFDPQQMRWISTLDPADEGPDPFAEMWGDDDDFGAGDTIRLSKFGHPGRGSFAQSTHSSMGSSRMPSEASSSISWHDQSFSSSHTQVERFGQGHLETISVELREECREAERRHRDEMRPWIVKVDRDLEGREMQWRNGKRLWEIRTLTRGMRGE